MKFDPQKNHRRSIRLAGHDYSQPGAYFVTIVAHQREMIFADVVDHGMQLSDCGRLADECLRLIPAHFPQVELGAYVVVPNHMHGIIILHDPAGAPASERGAATSSPPVGAQHVAPLPIAPSLPHVSPGSLGAILRAYKSSVTRIIIQEHGGSPNIWQRNYYEHIIRNESEYQVISDYILNNPFNWETDDENIRLRRRRRRRL